LGLLTGKDGTAVGSPRSFSSLYGFIFIFINFYMARITL
jgi:hypothetical protein